MPCFTPDQRTKCDNVLLSLTYIETANVLRAVAGTPKVQAYPHAPITRELQNLPQIVALAANAAQVSYAVLNKIEANSLCREFVIELHKWRPFDAEMTELVREFNELPVVEPDRKPRLEQLVRITVDQFLNPVDWAASFGPIRYAVCRVEHLPGPRPDATGFLVSADTVLTNHHVIEPVLNGTLPASNFTLGFDRIEYRGKELSGPTYGLMEPGDRNQWLVAENEELDYAVIKLDKPAGDEPLVNAGGGDGQAAKRGWLKLSLDGSQAIRNGDDQLIFQHPNGLPLKMDIGRVESQTPTRVKYDTSTMPGSSGSPCFDRKLRVVALHHAAIGSARNQGIPVKAIVDDLKSKQKDNEVDIA